MNTEKLSLWDAIIININVMFGTGVLINTINIAHKAGALGFLSYAVVAFIMLPIMLGVSELVKKYPDGGFYTYAEQTIGPWAGFLSSWTYFTGKLASATLLIHIFATTLKNIVIPLHTIPTQVIDCVILLFFLWLNQYNLKTGTKITYTFIVLKLMPIVGAILSCLYLAQHWSLPPATVAWHTIPSTIPLVLYAFVGFEAACSLSNRIKNSHINGPKAILYSYLFVVSITITYQFLMFTTLGSLLTLPKTFLDIFPTLLGFMFHHQAPYLQHLLHLLHIAIATSALGGSYSILLSNAWNLHTLALNNHLFKSESFKKLNAYGVPFLCIIAETFICLCYLGLTAGNQIALQQVSVFGCTLAYTLSILGLLALAQRSFLGYAGLASCLLLIITCLHNFFISDIRYLFIFIGIIASGMSMYWLSQKHESKRAA